MSNQHRYIHSSCILSTDDAASSTVNTNVRVQDI